MMVEDAGLPLPGVADIAQPPLAADGSGEACPAPASAV
jgi:hypothetical protein